MTQEPGADEGPAVLGPNLSPDRVASSSIIRTTAITRTENAPAPDVAVRSWIPLDIPALGEAKESQVMLHADIRMLEQRAVRRLGRFAPVTDEVRGLLQAAIDVGLKAHFTQAGRAAYAKAESTFLQHVQARNRLTYLTGLVAGFLIAGTLLWAMLTLAMSVFDSQVAFADPSDVVPLFGFAGMGTFVSVMTRLNSLDLADETSKKLLLISGAARPLTAIFFASVVYVILRHQFIPIQLGPPAVSKATTQVTSSGYQPAIGWIASFLCGFSERFATDIIGRLPFGAQEDKQATATSPSRR